MSLNLLRREKLCVGVLLILVLFVTLSHASCTLNT